MSEQSNNNESEFYDVNLRSATCDTFKAHDTPRPHSTSRINNFFRSAIRRTFRLKKRRHTTPVSENEILKCNISGPANVCEVTFLEDDFEFSRNSIQDCPFDIKGYGSFLLKNEFVVRKPKKMVLMVFLYEKILILTKKQENEDSFYYKGSFKMDQLSLLPLNPKYKNLLEIKDHENSTKFHKNIIIKLEAHSEYIQVEWRRAIEKCLWGQLLKAKAKSNRPYV